MIRFFLFLVFFVVGSTMLFAGEKITIKVGVLPIVDVLPIYVAEKKGYFEKENIYVDIIPCASASERDQLLYGGNLDLIVNDLISIALFNKEEINVVGVRYAILPTERYPQFYILSSKKRGIRRPQELKNVPIGISEATIIHYVTEKLLQKAGLKKDEIKVIPVPRIPDRLSALTKGDLPAATLPDPFGILAMIEGATLVLDDRLERSFSGSLYSFRKRFVETNKNAVKTFLLSIDRAIEDINRDKQKWANLIVEKRLVPAPLYGSYNIPDFPSYSVPEKKRWEDVIQWLMEKGLIKVRIPYGASINIEGIT